MARLVTVRTVRNPRGSQLRLPGVTVKKSGLGWYGAYYEGVNIGTVMLNDAETYAISVTVEPGFRRHGVASEMYRFIERDLGRRLRQSPHQTPTGDKFWKSRNPKGGEVYYANINNVLPPHEVRDPDHAKKISIDMKRRGWRGRPLVVIQSADMLQALTGSHRYQAALDAGLEEIPVLEIEGDARDLAWSSGGWDDMYGRATDAEWIAADLQKAGYGSIARQIMKNPVMASLVEENPFDFIDTQRFGANAAKHLQMAAGLSREVVRGISDKDIYRQFDIWWEYEGSQMNMGRKTENRRAFRKGWKDYGRGKRNPNRPESRTGNPTRFILEDPGQIRVGDYFRVDTPRLSANGWVTEINRVNVVYKGEYFVTRESPDGWIRGLKIRKDDLVGAEVVREVKIGDKHNPIVAPLVEGIASGTGFGIAAGVMAPLAVGAVDYVAERLGLGKKLRSVRRETKQNGGTKQNPYRLSKKDPSTMSAGEINSEFCDLDEIERQFGPSKSTQARVRALDAEMKVRPDKDLLFKLKTNPDAVVERLLTMARSRRVIDNEHDENVVAQIARAIMAISKNRSSAHRAYAEALQYQHGGKERGTDGWEYLGNLPDYDRFIEDRSRLIREAAGRY